MSLLLLLIQSLFVVWHVSDILKTLFDNSKEQVSWSVFNSLILRVRISTTSLFYSLKCFEKLISSTFHLQSKFVETFFVRSEISEESVRRIKISNILECLRVRWAISCFSEMFFFEANFRFLLEATSAIFKTHFPLNK